MNFAQPLGTQHASKIYTSSAFKPITVLYSANYNYQGISQNYLNYGIIGTLFDFLLFLEVFSINDVASMSDEPLKMFDIVNTL
ncbi:hypothetical protein GCM10027192_20880 [Psychrobacter pocilloporae]|uniref:Uncharacterized protein n=1 Tax=Psychrobacter pocilloporae TaxID=1775882 RepID=A0ABT6IRL8_9GAMM|nr:hypothetical protein [Psychrobacter pocilloporae]